MHNNDRRARDKWRDRIFDFALGAVLSMAVSLATIYPRVVGIEQRLKNVEQTLETITTITVRQGHAVP